MLRGRVRSARPRRACTGVGARGRMMVIRFFASIRNITGVKEIEWDEPTPTLGELLRLLSDRYGPEFRRWVVDGEHLGGSVMVVINGDDARHQGGVATRLAPADVVSIFPIMAGGIVGSVQQSAISSQQERGYMKGLQNSGWCDHSTLLRFRFRQIADR